MALRTSSIEREFKQKVCNELEVVSQGNDRYIIHTPMSFGDGDALSIVLKKKEGNGWVLSDEGHTFLQLTYELDEEDLKQATRREIIDRTLLSLGVQNLNGELVLPIRDQHYGDALYSFIQALLKIDDVRYLSRERVRSTFIEDFRELMTKITAPERVSIGWHHPDHDPKANYPVDCRINGTQTPLFVFALSSDERAAIAGFSILRFETWGLKFKGIGIFEEEETISPRAIARFGDVAHKTFSNLAAAREGLSKFFPELNAP
jgi:Domain of unknown function DUF1828